MTVKSDSTKSGQRFKIASFTLTLAPVADSNAAAVHTDSYQSKQFPAWNQIADRFATRVQLIWTFLKEIGTVADATSFTNMASVFVLLLEIADAAQGKDDADALAVCKLALGGTTDDGTPQAVEISAPVHEERHLKSLRERTKYHDAALRLLHESAVQQLVNAFEHLLGDIVRRHIFNNTGAASRDEKITYQELLEFSSLEEAQRRVVERQVTDFIRNNDTPQYFKYLKDSLGVDVQSHFPGLPRFRELVYRRHAIVHAGGLVTPEYLRRVRSLGVLKTLPAEGRILDLPEAYITDSWDLVYALGITTLHLITRAEAKSRHDQDKEEEADYWLINAGYWAIEQQRYSCAEQIFGYASKLHLSKNSCQLTVLINLAQSLKWQKRDSECEALLAEEDWGATNSLFRFCAHVLRDEAEVSQHLTRAVADGELTLESIYSWPVFQGFRKRPDFSSLLDKAFGVGWKRPEETFPASLLDFKHDSTLDAILKHLAKVGGGRLKARAITADSPVENPQSKVC
jgi:hypothetical protein